MQEGVSRRSGPQSHGVAGGATLPRCLSTTTFTRTNPNANTQDVLDAYITAAEAAPDDAAAAAAAAPLAAITLRALSSTARAGAPAAASSVEPGGGMDALLARAAAALPPGDLPPLLRSAVDALEQKRAHPRAALALVAAAAAHAAAAGSTAGTDAADAAATALDRALAAPWPSPPATAVEALRSAPLTLAQADALRARALRDAASGDPADLPALARQLLLLKPRAAAAGALLGLVALLDDVAGAGAPHSTRDAAATVLLAVELAAKADPEGARGWPTSLAARPAASPAAAAALLTLVGVPRLRGAAVDALSTALTRASRAAAAAATSPWAATLPRLPLPAAAALEDALLAAVARGGDVLVPPALTLADALIEAGGAAAAALPPDAAATARVGDADACLPAERGARLGVRLLVAAFGAGSRSARSDVLSLATARLAAAAADGGGGAHIAALAGIASTHAADLGTGHPDAVRDALALAGDLPPSRGADLVAALWPACRAVAAARDAAALVLRKSAFGRAAPARAAAVRGLLLLATAEARAGGDAGPSQAPLSQAASLAGGAGSALAELTSFLRRCLAQQPSVRAALYEGAPSVAAADAGAAAALGGLLAPHLASYVGAAGGPSPPLRLEKAVVATPDGGRLLEPLPALLASARRVVLAARGVDHGSATVHPPPTAADLAAAFTSARDILTASVPEDYGLDKASGVGEATPEGDAARARAHMLAGCLEIAMEDALAGAASGDTSPGDAVDALAAAFRVHDRLRGLLATAPPPSDGGKRGRAAADAPPPPALSPTAAAALLGVVCDDRMPFPPSAPSPSPCTPRDAASPPRGARLARDAAFQAFALRTAAALAASTPPGPRGAAVRSTLAPPLLKCASLVALAYCHRGRAVGGAAAGGPRRGARDPGDGLPLLAVQAVATLLRGVGGPAELRALLAAADDGDATGAAALVPALTRLAELGNHREVDVLASSLAAASSVSSPPERAALAAAARTALGRAMPHGPAVRALVTLLLASTGPDGDASAAADVARAVAEVLVPAGGDGGDAATAASVALPAVAARTLPAAAGALADALASALTEADWALGRARAARAALGGAPSPPCVAAVDDAACARVAAPPPPPLYPGWVPRPRRRHPARRRPRPGLRAGRVPNPGRRRARRGRRRARRRRARPHRAAPRLSTGGGWRPQAAGAGGGHVAA